MPFESWDTFILQSIKQLKGVSVCKTTKGCHGCELTFNSAPLISFWHSSFYRIPNESALAINRNSSQKFVHFWCWRYHGTSSFEQVLFQWSWKSLQSHFLFILLVLSFQLLKLGITSFQYLPLVFHENRKVEFNRKISQINYFSNKLLVKLI